MAGCRHRTPASLPLIKVSVHSFEALPDWQQDHAIHEAFEAFKKSCPVLLKMPTHKPVGLGTAAGDWHSVCRKALALEPKNNKEIYTFFENHFIPYRVSNDGNHEGLFTGYYESELHGSRVKTDRFHYPLYKKPPEVVVSADKNKRWGRLSWGSIVPYYDRRDIDKGALEGRHLELVWVDDPIEAFFLHVQGSGRVRLPDGSIMRVGYAGQNGHPFVAIGKKLIERRALDSKKVSMQSIREWMASNPEESLKLMHENPSYIFFREITEKDGPIGCMGIAVTPGRTMAVDRRIWPMGAPLWFDGAHPDNSINIRRLMIAQDTGGAIRGAVRGDFFWGYGKNAQEQAGKMKIKGQYYVLLPKDARVHPSYLH